MTRLLFDRSLRVPQTKLVYRPDDYAFSAEPRPHNRSSSVLVNDLELIVDGPGGQVVLVEGYCPYQSWAVARLAPPASERAGLRVAGVEFLPGVANELDDPRTRDWPVSVDPESGWLCIGDRTARHQGVEFAPGCVAVLDGETLVALWLRPASLPPSVMDLKA